MFAAEYNDELAHKDATSSLKKLLSFGKKACKDACVAEGSFALGPIHCNIYSNSVEAFHQLTHCLFSADQIINYSEFLSIYILCGQSLSNIQIPVWNFQHTDSRHRERLHISEEGITAYYDADFKYWMILDIHGKTALFWVATLDSIPFWERAAPFKSILNWFLSNKSFTMVHGGAVSLNGRAILLVGPGGSGKSSTVGTCFINGFQVCGDDLIIVGSRGSKFTVYTIYNSIKLLPASLAHGLNVLGLSEWGYCGEKRFARYSDLRLGQTCKTSSVVAIMRCFVSGENVSDIKVMQPSSILKFIIPPTVFMLRGHEASSIKKISHLARSINCFQLNLGSDSNEISRSLRAFIEMSSHAT